MTLRHLSISLAAAALGCGAHHLPGDLDSGPGEEPTGPVCAETGAPDGDGDGVVDDDEGGGALDTDRDGAPDVADLDSDGDGIADAVEAGRASCAEPPVDSDGDGTPDLRDPDSDDNGVPDRSESDRDLDGDGALDFRDLDDDGDGIGDALEIGPDPTDPADSDADGVPDWHDRDSDDDGVDDELEGSSDVDGDGLGAFRDPDSDGDGLRDAEEGPEDCDGDGAPAFLDPDSDDDGLDDGLERAYSTDPCNADTDSDGLIDPLELALGTDPLDASGPLPGRELFVAVAPYGDRARDAEVHIDAGPLETELYLLVDGGPMMYGAVPDLGASLGRIVRGAFDRWTGLAMGLGWFSDVPTSPYGWTSDQAFEQLVSLTPDRSEAEDALRGLGRGVGGDSPTSGAVALWALATGSGDGALGIPSGETCSAGRSGYPCFRREALSVVALLACGPFHNGPPDGGAEPYSGLEAPSWVDAVDALVAASLSFVGIAVGSGWDIDRARADLEATAMAVGSTRASDGSPLVWDAAGSGDLASVVAEAVDRARDEVTPDVALEAVEDPLVDDGIDATRFVRALRPVEASPLSGALGMTEGEFLSVRSGTDLTFAAEVQNDLVPQGTGWQAFPLALGLVGTGGLRFGEADLVVLVPPGGY